MSNYKEEFIEFMVESDVLKFGDFTLKSGRKSPFFMNISPGHKALISTIASICLISIYITSFFAIIL